MLKLNDVEIKQSNFPDNTLCMSVEDRDELFRPANNITWIYENDAELFSLICLRKTIGDDKKCSLFMPYCPHARMDRVQDDKVFTLKYFCEVINSLNFDGVYINDPHSYVCVALLDRVHVRTPNMAAVLRHFNQNRANVAIFFPDDGAMKRYTNDIFVKSYPIAYGVKNRNFNTGEIVSYEVAHADNIKDKNVLIIDDICSRGGTFKFASEALKKAGAKSTSLYVTHCENTILDGEFFNNGYADIIYTTKSLVHKPELAESVIYVEDLYL